MRIDIQNFLSILSASLLSWLLNLSLVSDHAWYVSFLLTLLAGLFIYVLFYVLIARIFPDYGARIKGCWLQKVKDPDSEDFYSITYLKYNYSTKSMMFYGYSFNEKGESIGQFKSDGVFPNKEKYEVFYAYDGRFNDRPDQRKLGVGYIHFVEMQSGSYETATGFFVETQYQMRCSFKMDRISKNLTNELIEKDEIATSADMEKFVRKYHVHISEQLSR